MGSLRLYITLIIVIGHLHTWYGFSFPMAGMVWSGGLMGIARVHVFFLQSGFLTQCQFIERTVRRGPILHYYRKRFMRIYPQYLLFLLLTAVAYALFGDAGYLRAMERKGAGTAEMLFANLFALNLPILRLWGMDSRLASGYLLLPQAWTLTIQFGFILLAPFVLGSGRRLLALTLLSAAFMLYYYAFTPLTRNFFVTELAYFWFGALTARLTLWLEPRLNRQIIMWLAAGFIAPTVIMALWYSVLETVAGAWPMFAGFNFFLAASMIPAYLLSRGSVIDRFFSRMTYSLYLCQMLAAFLVRHLGLPPYESGMLALGLALLVAAVINLPVANRKNRPSPLAIR